LGSPSIAATSVARATANHVGTGNDNIFYAGNPGQLYNEATVLGVPDLARFAADLAR
jgi:hypothetical protein